MAIWIFDVDGTLANAEHRLHLVVSPNESVNKKKDWNEFMARADKDVPYWHVVKLLRLLYASGDKIIIVTGRSYDKSAIVTIEWFKRHHIPYDAIYFRETGDHRCDTIVKDEIRQRIEREHGPIECVVEDRKRVVDMWRSYGIPCLHVAEGNF